MSEKTYNSTAIPGMQGMSLKTAAKRFGADTIGIKKVKNTKNDGRPDFCFLMVDGTSMGQASENIRKSGEVPSDAVISGFRDNTTGQEFYILHAQGAGETTTLLDMRDGSGSAGIKVAPAAPTTPLVAPEVAPAAAEK